MIGKKKRKNPEHCHKLVEIQFTNESHLINITNISMDEVQKFISRNFMRSMTCFLRLLRNRFTGELFMLRKR